MQYNVNKTVILEEMQMLQEELTPQQKEAYDRKLGVETAGALVGGIPIVNALNPISQMYGGYQAGKGLGHPIAGLFLGREGALGAASTDETPGNDKITVKDAYSKGNTINRVLGGATTLGGVGAMLGYLTGKLHNEQVHQYWNHLSDEFKEHIKDHSYGPQFVDPVEHAIEPAAIGLGAGALLGAATPAIKYGVGKLFGSKTPSKPE